MRKLIFVNTGLIITIIFTIFLFQVRATTLKINKSLILVQKNQLNLEEKISKYNLQLNKKITELTKETEEGNRNLGITLIKAGSSYLTEIEEVKSLIVFNTEAVNNKNAAEQLFRINALVEADNLIQQLLDEGALKYRGEDFTAAIKVYEKILDIDPSNTEALCYFNASLYYQNPGDGSNFPSMKSDLIPLVEEGELVGENKRNALLVLIGIGREEGDSTSLKQYEDSMFQMEVVN